MKKYIVYLGILAVGLLLGWILFGGSPKEETDGLYTWERQDDIPF